MQDIEAARPLVPAEYVGRGVAFGMADVQTRAGRVGEHVEDVELGFGAVVVGGKGFVLKPMVLPLWLDDVEWIFLAEFRHNGGSYTGSGNFRQASVTDAVAFFAEVCFSTGGFTPRRKNMETKCNYEAWLKGSADQCNADCTQVSRPYRLVLLGAPGVGKGTQAELLRDKLGACHFSTGDIFRAAKGLTAAERSPAMNSALDYMKRGELVPDTTVVDIIRERITCLRCENGFLLDGFPRTVAQAEVLQTILASEKIKLDAVVDYEMPIDEVVARISGRRTCPKCKAGFHITGMPPKQAGICDKCGTALVQREDDRPEAVRVRMAVYAKSTTPLIQFYRQRNLLVTIAATGTPEEIAARTLKMLPA